MAIIYKASNVINNKIYIGKTINTLNSRKRDHIARSKRMDRKNTYFYKAIKKYGEKSFIWETICECDNSEASELEKYYISKFNSTDPKIGYNTMPGGDTDDIETLRHRRALAQIERFKDVKEREKVRSCKPILQYNSDGVLLKEWDSQIEAAQHLSLSSCNISMCCYRRYKSIGGYIWRFKNDPLNEDDMTKLPFLFIKKPDSQETIEKRAKNQYKSILQYALNGEFLKEWRSIKEASIALNVHNSNIVACCKRKKLFSNGFIWRYVDDPLSENFDLLTYFKGHRTTSATKAIIDGLKI